MKANLMRTVMVMILLIIPFSAHAQTTSDFEITLTDGSTVTVSTGDKIKIAKLVSNEPSVKHTNLSLSMYSVSLDNGQFDNNSVLSFTELSGDNQEIVLDHSEFRYNLVVSIEWDADVEYIRSVERGFRNLANYLYDVTDGQVRLDTVMIYDDQDHWLDADIRIRASNTQWPTGSINGIHLPGLGDVVTFPRKWYGDGDDTRNGTYLETPPIDFSTPANYRQMAHELGHYLFGFDEEYEFADGLGHCGAVSNYGFMDYPYSGGGAYSSEMSNPESYIAPECQNTFQYQRYLQSCWEHFETDFEGLYGPNSIFAPIITPAERGAAPFVGPNDDFNALNYDVGALVQFPVSHTGPTAFTLDVVTHDWQLNPLAKIDVVLRHPTVGRAYYDIYQGQSSDLNLPNTPGGGIYVLGAKTGDLILASSDYTITGIGSLALSPSSQSWLTGTATVGAPGDTLALVLKPIEGDFPLIPALSDYGDSTLVTLTYTTSLPTTPTIEGLNRDGDHFTYDYVDIGTAYEALLNETFSTSGIFTIWAQDNADSAFFFNLAFTRARWEKSAPQELLGPKGICALRLDTAGFDNARVALMVSPYPVLRDGLLASALLVGQSCALSVSQPLFSGDLSLRYNDADMSIDSSRTGRETSIQMYHWGAAGWEFVGGTLDTANNIVHAAVSESGVYALFSSDILTDVESVVDDGALPYAFALSQNHPNPFNPVTTIEYHLPRRSNVRIDIYNLIGQKVRTLVDGEESAGSYSITWDGTSSSGEAISTGVYFYRFQAGDHVETKKMLLLK